MRKLTLLMAMIFITGAIGQVMGQSGKEIKLSMNKLTALKGSKLTFKLIAVEDSRCPPDVNCIWAGNAKIKFTISKGKSAAKTFELNTGLDPKKITFDGYEIEVNDLSPTPKSTDPKPANYLVKLSLTKIPKSK